MAGWLDPLAAALDAATAPVTFYFRDDDAGWRPDRLGELLDRFDAHGLPLDVAVIPRDLDEEQAARLRERHAAAGGRLGLHQHGFAHANHETEGKKQEFGPARSRAEQQADIAAGRARLDELLGPIWDPMFTPPWNRCTADTATALVAEGFRVLSREARVERLGVDGLAELDVHVDWFAKRKGVPLERAEIGELVAGFVAGGGPVGVMFHHAVMDAGEMAAAGELLSLLALHRRCRFTRMPALVGQAPAR